MHRVLGPAAVAGLAGLTLAPSAAAEEAAAAVTTAAVMELDPLTVLGSRREPESPKYTAPLLDTPQTITIISDQVIRAQNLLSLRDVLSTVPGVTFGAGEGGGGYGDSINLRGYSANNDITTDGLRDSAQYTRSDPFNIQQVEVVNGANSVYAGSGSVGGTINLVTKTPTGAGVTTLTGGVGTDGYLRATVDSDIAVSDGVGVRLNAMAHQSDVPGRDVERYERWGIAPSIAFGLNSPTRFSLAWFHQEDENVPEYGVPYFRNDFNSGPLPDADPSNYYGYRNIDRQEITVDSVTAKFAHEFAMDLALRNITRWQRVTQLAVVNPPQGTWCLASGINPATGAPCAAPGTYQPSGPRGNLRDTENTLLATQTDLTWRFETGAVRHTLTAGFSLSHESYKLDTGRVLRNPLGAQPDPVLPPMDIADPDNLYAGPVNYIRTQIRDGELDNRAVYVFDTVELSPQWEVSAGLRFEQTEGKYTIAAVETPYPTPPAEPAISQGPIGRNSDDLFSYRVGVVYKPIPSASLYVAYGNSETPSQATVNGGCEPTDQDQNCNVDPEEAVSYELGGKWDLYGGRLSLSGAIFRNERTNFRVDSGDPTLPAQQLDGRSRVDGVALGVSGQVTERWAVFANYTYLDSEVLQSISDFLIGDGAVDIQKGEPIPDTPEHAFSLWTTYDVTERLQLGYGANYTGDYYMRRRPSSAPRMFKQPGHWVHNAAVIYRLNEAADLQLNVKNVLDEEYYVRIRNNGWATPGEARSATLTVNYRF